MTVYDIAGPDRAGAAGPGPATMLAATRNDARLFAGDRPPGEPCWLTIAHWGDKHDLFLCCERDHLYFGSVVHGHDDHPWLDGGFNNRVAGSFTQYLRSLA
jgi:hypothetical protein